MFLLYIGSFGEDFTAFFGFFFFEYRRNFLLEIYWNGMTRGAVVKGNDAAVQETGKQTHSQSFYLFLSLKPCITIIQKIKKKQKTRPWLH